jgi:hypothetical protein
VLADSFGGTAQPPRGVLGVTIWYLENGFQTKTPFGNPLYF